MPKRRTWDELVEHVTTHVDVDDNGCWNYLGAKNHKGYGRTRFSPVRGGASHNISVHRISLLASLGKEFDEYKTFCEQACHTCDNPSCTNPAHMYAGTQVDNTRDMVARGNQRGEKPKRTKITEQAARAVKHLYLAGNLTKAQIGKMYGIAPSTVYCIGSGSRWSHV